MEFKSISVNLVVRKVIHRWHISHVENPDEYVGWMQVVEVKFQRWASVSTVMNLWVPWKWNFLNI